MIQKFLFTFFLIGFASSILSQKDTLKNDAFGAFVIMPIEFPVIENQQINNELMGLGYPKCDYSPAIIGIGFQLYTDRLISTFSLNKTTKKNDNESYLTEVEYRSTSLNIGYDLTKNHRYSIYPFVGIKGYSLSYLYREKISSTSSFNDYFNTELEYKEITNSRTNIDLGIGFSYQWFFLVNFRAGYLLPVGETGWKINNTDYLSGSPSLRHDFYFTLTVGLGNIFSDQELREAYGDETE